MISLAQRIVESTFFNRFIIGVIVFAGILVGIETFPAVMDRWGPLLHALDAVVLTIFTVEIVLKMVALAPKPWRFFRSGWNVFDFIIVAVCFLPFAGGYVAVLRLMRLLRVLRLITAVPRLQLIVGALLKSLPSMVYVGILLFMLFYIYAVLGVILFRANDPIHFGNLWTSLLSLFRVVTLEDWTDIMYIQMQGSDAYRGYNQSVAGLALEPKAQPVIGALFFVSFVLLGTMIMLNLVIGVVLNGMEEAQKEIAERQVHHLLHLDEDSGSAEEQRDRRIAALQDRLREITDELQHLR